MAAKVLKKGSKGDLVKGLQEALQSTLRLNDTKLPIDGDFGKLTDQAVRQFQKKNSLGVDGIAGPNTFAALGQSSNSAAKKIAKKAGVRRGAQDADAAAGGDPLKRGAENISGLDKLRTVNSGLQKKVKLFAAKFGPITVTSGKRTVKKQAELMAPMADKDLNMYGPRSAYIVQIKALPKSERTVKKVEEILTEARSKGSRVSYHLAGQAVDISAKGGFDWSKANKIAREVGLTVKEERWRNCFHVQN